MFRSKKALQASEAEVARLTNELARAEEQYEQVMARVTKERLRHREFTENMPRRDLEQVRELLELIRFSPLFPATDVAAPSYTAEQVSQGVKRISKEIEQ